MRIEAVDRLTDELEPAGEPALWEIYHANSKLRAEMARREAERFAVSPHELHVSSRGFKQYRNGATVPLPKGPSPPQRSLEDVMMSRRSARALTRPLPLPALATLLRQGLGPSTIVRHPEHGIEQVLRTWPSAGGLFPLDTYVIAAKVNGLAPGCYHYNVVGDSLERLETQSAVEDVLAASFFWQEFATECAAAIVLVAAFDRTVAKYGERGYRLVLLDAGHAGQNVLLVAEQLGLAAVPMAGFNDEPLESLLDLDGTGESVVHTILSGGAP